MLIPPLSSLTPLSPAEMIREAACAHRAVLQRWVALGVGVMLGVGLGWHYSRQWRQAARSRVVRPTDDARAIALVRLALSLKKRPRALTPIEALTLVRSALDLRGIDTAGPPAQMSRVQRLKQWLAQIDSLEAPGADLVERARHLVELARQVAPLTPGSAQMLEAELISGGLDAVTAGRDAAVFRLRRFCVGFGIAPPHGVMNPFAWARVVAHDAPHLPTVSVTGLQCEGFAHWVLAYRPDRLARAGLGVHAAFQPPQAAGLTPLEARREAAGLALLRALLAQAITPLALRWRARDPIFWARLARRMDAVWGAGNGPEDLTREFAHASARLLAEVVWGEHANVDYEDRWGLIQLLSCALATLPEKTVALRAWLTPEPVATDRLGVALLGAARLLENSRRRPGE